MRCKLIFAIDSPFEKSKYAVKTAKVSRFSCYIRLRNKNTRNSMKMPTNNVEASPTELRTQRVWQFKITQIYEATSEGSFFLDAVRCVFAATRSMTQCRPTLSARRG